MSMSLLGTRMHVSRPLNGIRGDGYGFCFVTELPFHVAVTAITATLKQQGFSAFTEVDVQSMLKHRRDVDVSSYVILGACNLPLSHDPAQPEPGLLPCNVIVYDNDDGTCTIRAADPSTTMRAADDSVLDWIAVEAKARLRAALLRVPHILQPAAAPPRHLSLA